MIYRLLLIFFIYSVIGWIGEILFCLPFSGKITNRGFAYGPICPVYGFGAIFVLYGLSRFIEYPFLIFTFGLLGATLLEYITSVIMEKIFKMRWWDYSNHKYHFQGRICLINSISFGLGSLIIVYLLHPLVNRLLSFLSENEIMIASLSIFLFWMLDFIASIYSAFRFKTLYEKDKIEVSKQKGFNRLIFTHFTDSYPNIK